MNRFTKFALAATAVFTVCSAPVFANSNIFGTGLVLTLDIGGGSNLDLFEATLLGDSRQSPTSPSLGQPALITSGAVDSGSQSLGAFNTFTGDTLTLDGGEVLTFKNSGDDITGANLHYSIDGGSFSTVGLGFNQDNVNGASGDQRWYTDGANANLLSGLGYGSHTISFYFDAPFTFTGPGSGTHTENNGGSNFSATFTVVPEPSTIMMLLSSGLFGSFYLVSRRRK